MTNKELQKKIKQFLENFTLDFDRILKELKEIMTIDFAINNCNEKMHISFEECDLLGRSGRVNGPDIYFNKTRFETLVNLKIDDTDETHLNKINDFYLLYDKKKGHSRHEKILYDFLKRYKELGVEHHFAKMGSYKTIKYGLVDTILHEDEHVFQKKYKEYLSKNKFPHDTRSALLIFTMAFNKMFYDLEEKDINLDYKRKNHIFPIEFDARYESMKQLSAIKDLYFKQDEMFAKYLVQSNIIPDDFDIEKTSQQIFADYERIYKLYEENFGDKYSSVNKFIQNNKNKLIGEFARRYNEMQEISNRNKNVNKK